MDVRRRSCGRGLSLDGHGCVRSHFSHRDRFVAGTRQLLGRRLRLLRQSRRQYALCGDQRADHRRQPVMQHRMNGRSAPPASTALTLTQELHDIAILDRIIHRAHRIDLKGPSLHRRLVTSEAPLHERPSTDRPRGAKQRLPTRAAQLLVRALRAARVPSVDSVDDPLPP
jgi:hypothetical protein